MSAILRSSADAAASRSAPTPLLRTLVLCDLVDSTALVERLGDLQAAEIFRRHDRLTDLRLQRLSGLGGNPEQARPDGGVASRRHGTIPFSA